ncbi:DUF808 domain-containing protein [Limimaricola hongkongensis]|uniref:Membrane protein, putative n=1 Tax=Limimaricola hongkongensis DSM 17492 TaxID=1122180 RepID=A0A017HGQ2_9RHOB|nr:DUF808 domain-containing protein [Limimaricola hongkongensis]EYD73672.1 Membrane protein, putative [Limimaricola hongkongensis DSM 17492]
MSSGLFALLDDVALIARTAAASLDDVAAATLKAGSKSAGVVIDDAAVTPKYVLGFAADRELPIIRKIGIGSLRNKILVLLPAALALSFLAPWAITPLLMLGGLFLAYEGAEKIAEVLLGHGHGAQKDAPLDEDSTVKGAIRTDFILSAEIMALTLSTVADQPFVTQAVVLGLVGIFITFIVYGAVAVIVKADDLGIALAARGPGGLLPAFGRFLVKAMPYVLKLLSIVGTAAMLWVSGGILIHGLEAYHIALPGHLVHDATEFVATQAPILPGALGWLTGATMMGVVGLAVGAVIVAAMSVLPVKRPQH